MKLNRNYVTPFISLVFLVVGISGLLMLFHLFDGYTEVVHEILGVFFIICAIFHIILNWNALKIHFQKAVFIPALLGVLTISVILIISERMYPPIDLAIFNKMVKAPINDAFKVLDINYDKASIKLKEKGILIEKATTIEEIWIKNNTNPEEVIDLIME
jgi:amino acid transporter